MRHANVMLYKVATIASKAGEDGLYMHLMIAPTADCWQVYRNQIRAAPSPWSIGDIVGLPVAKHRVIGGRRTVLVPRWKLVGATRPVKFDLARPYEAVSLAWNEDVAKQFVLETLRLDR
jgi:hypothetical protein